MGSLLRRVLVAAAAVTALVVAAACTTSTSGSGPSVTFDAGAAASRPNIVFVLTDDLSWNLVPYLPQVQQMQRDGMTFTNYTVTDSLCCPSRSSLFTGDFPHDTGVFTNTSPDGGFALFHSRGEEAHTYATALHDAGYATGMMGKYLNGYQPDDQEGTGTPYVAPGWSEWDVAGNGYPEYNYALNQDHSVVKHGSAPTDYLTDVLSKAGTDFITRSAQAHTPFALEVATFAPHSPYTPAPQDTTAFLGLTAPRTPAYDTVPSRAPRWLAGEPALTAKEQQAIDADFRKRAQAVQAVDRMIASIRARLQATGVADNTYLVFSSDNGYHMGEYRLTPGKQTAFDTDVRVPLVVVGPRVPHGVSDADLVQNTDLAPTFESLAGLSVPDNVDGHSLVGLWHGQPDQAWRTAALVEHHGPNDAPDDPDLQTKRNGDPTTYEALRTATFTYVEYATGEKEYYDRSTDPDELHNTASNLDPARATALHGDLQHLVDCHGGSTCWTAGHLTS